MNPYTQGYLCAITLHNDPFKSSPYETETEEYVEWWTSYCNGTESLVLINTS